MTLRKTALNTGVLLGLQLTTTALFAAPVEIRFSHVTSENSPKGQMATKFKTLVEQHMNDKFRVTIYPNSKLFSDSKVLEAMLDGKVEMAAPSMSKLKKYSSRYQVFDLPFIFSSPVSAEKFTQGEFGDRLLSTLRSKGFHGLGYLNNGMRQLSSNKRMELPEDLSGSKFRYSGSSVAKQWLTNVGAEPIKISFSKVYDALKDNKIDGQVNTWSNILSKKFHEQQKYILESNHSYIGYAILTSNTFWTSLPQEDQTQLKKYLKEAINYGNEIAKIKATSDRQAVIDSGLATVYKLSVDQRQLWTEAMLPVWKRFENEIGTTLIQAAASQR